MRKQLAVRAACLFFLLAGTGLAPLALGADGATGADGYSPPAGQTASPITDHFALRLSYSPLAVHTQLRLDPTGLPNGGTPVSGENDLGLPRKNPEGLVELIFRLHERNRMRVDYFQLDRSGNAVVDRTIIFGNETYDVGNAVQTSLNWKMMGFTYTRALIQNDRFELGVGLGVHLLDADVTGTDPTLIETHETAKTGAFPTGALETMWRISRRFAFTGRGQYFRAAYHGFTGSLGEYHGDFQYRWKPPFALGVGYSYTRASFADPTSNTPGRVVLSAGGPEAFVRVSF
jgi:hypothetical protein